MPFNPDTKKKIVRNKETNQHHPCIMCGTTYPRSQAAHIVDQKEWKEKHKSDSQINGIPLCPNCHHIFEDILRPHLHRALEKFGVTDLPESWKTSNKIRSIEKSPSKQNLAKPLDSNLKRVLDLLRKTDKDKRPRKRKALETQIASYFQKNLQEKDVLELVNRLFSEGFVSELNKVLTYNF